MSAPGLSVVSRSSSSSSLRSTDTTDFQEGVARRAHSAATSTLRTPPGQHVKVEFRPPGTSPLAEKSQAPEFQIGEQRFRITKLTLKRPGQKTAQEIKIEDLGQDDLDRLSQACERLYGTLNPNAEGKPLEKIAFKFVAPEETTPFANRCRAVGNKVFNFLRRRVGRPEQPLEPLIPSLKLKEYSIQPRGGKPVRETFELGAYKAEDQMRLLPTIQSFNSPVRSILGSAPLPELKSLSRPLVDKKREAEREKEKILQLLNAYLDKREEAALGQLKAAITTYERKYGASEDLQYVKEIIADFKHANILMIKPDGNCFYSAVKEALGLEDDSKHLRQQVADWLSHNKDDPTVHRHLVDTVRDAQLARLETLQEQLASLQLLQREGQDVGTQIGALSGQIRTLEETAPENLIDGYINSVRNDRFFAGLAEMYAVSQIYAVNITVKRKLGEVVLERPVFEIQNPDAGRTITLIHVNGDHFDLQVDA